MYKIFSSQLVKYLPNYRLGYSNFLTKNFLEAKNMIPLMFFLIYRKNARNRKLCNILMNQTLVINYNNHLHDNEKLQQGPINSDY